MSVGDLQALVKSVGYTAASRTTGIARGTLYGIVTGYGRRGRARKSTSLPTRGAAARPEIRERLAEKVTLAVLYVRAIQVKQDEDTGEVVTSADPHVSQVVYGDSYREDRDATFAGMYFAQDPPMGLDAIGKHLDDYWIIKQESLEQATDRPARPFIRRKQVEVENLGSPEGAVIVAYLWRFYRERGSHQRAPVSETKWLRPMGKLRAWQNESFGEDRVRAAYAAYERDRPRRSQ